MTAARAAILYSGLLCLCYALLPSLTFPNPPLDVVEGFAWGRELQLGYTKHPPMQAWLLEASYLLTGGHSLGAYWLSALCAALGYWFIWLIAKELGLSGWQGFWAIVLTSVTFYFTLPLPEFNPNILQIPVWAGMMFFFLRAISKGALLDWVLLGALAAFGFYTKYFVVLLIGTIGLYMLVYADARKHLTKPGPWICAVVFLLLVSPHLYWLYETEFLTFRYALGRSNPAGSLFDHVYNPVNFFLAQVANHAGLFIVIALGLSWQTIRTFKATLTSQVGPEPAANADRFLLWFAFLPLAVVLLISAVTGSEFKHMWGTPLFVLSGLVAVRFLHLPALWSAPKRSLASAVVIQLIFLGVLFGQAVLEPLWKTKHSRIHYPGQSTADVLVDIWKEKVGTDLAYVAGDMWTTANVTLHAPSRPSMFLEHDPLLSPWIDLEDVQDKGVMIIWRGDSAQPDGHIQTLYPDAVRSGTKTLPFHTYGTFRDLKINWLIIPPGKVAMTGDE
ncbi:glycosyltransferase family 39 protein [Labrenzia sp. PHM005]|uniref:glycosyltransferase family 39 protein n=1 Tax=Labrenzia sp. PHM005 TaxID=2590016 RepID=UPI00113FF5A4|nr:glycosyltransferase family 39 protein [Labrenzia sp. PHM005]QDG75612.1 glycosyltransferase family 39 protein [Labrenzia sp. PHM005]